MSGMRTTIRLPGDLLEMAKRKAAAEGRTLTDLITDAVRVELAVNKSPASIELPVFKGDGVRPGIDINNMAQVLDLIDELERR
jgi:hypothetical protein